MKWINDGIGIAGYLFLFFLAVFSHIPGVIELNDLERVIGYIYGFTMINYSKLSNIESKLLEENK